MDIEELEPRKKGPAPLNLWLPGEVGQATQALYKFTNDTTITIG